MSEVAAYTPGVHSARSRRMFEEGRAAIWRQFALQCRAAGETEAAQQAIRQARRALSVCAALAPRG